MRIEKILENVQYEIMKKGKDTEVRNIKSNSSLVTIGDLFVALVGDNNDGHRYIEEACNRGAKFIVINYDRRNLINESVRDVTVILVKDTRLCLSTITNNFYGNPTKKFRLIGVTGTNGKTSVTTIVHQVMLRLGYKVGLVGTIHDYINNEIVGIEKTTVTTPDCVELGKIMKVFEENEVEIVLMEVSSMALKNHRVDACDFDIVAFNNISPEHLDNHKTMEDYKKSKLLLFDMADKSIVNVDDDFSGTVLSKCKGKILKYGIKKVDACDLYADNIEYYTDRVDFCVLFSDVKAKMSVKIPSEFAVYNVLAAISICIMSGIKFDDIVEALKQDIPVEGRYDVVREKVDFTAVIDYAHTPVAFENVLKAVCANKAYNRIITVFGCGGDRDRSKRSVMGHLCQTFSDFTIVTLDNPRTESPHQIFSDILGGIDVTKDNYCVIEDREEAINYAVNHAMKDDVIVILGKGHEKIQIMNGYVKEFSDKEVVVRAMRRRSQER